MSMPRVHSSDVEVRSLEVDIYQPPLPPPICSATLLTRKRELTITKQVLKRVRCESVLVPFLVAHAHGSAPV